MSDEFFEKMSPEEQKKYVKFLEEKTKEKEAEKPMSNLGRQFEEMGKSLGEVRQSLPSVKIGGEPGFEDPIISKLKKYLLWGLTVLIGVVFGSLLVWRLILKFF